MYLLFIPVKVVVFAECKTVAVDGSFVVAPTAVVGKYGCDFVAVVMDDNAVVEHGSAVYRRRFGKFFIWIGKEFNQFCL